MDATGRQLVLLVSVLALLAVVMLFLFVYAPDPLQGFNSTFNAPGPVKAVVEALAGFVGLIIDGFDLFL